MNRNAFGTVLLACAASVLIVSCGGGGGSGGGSGNGTLSLAVTDAPVDDLERVVVVFTGVELQPTDGARFSIDFDAPKSIDLLALQGTESELLLDGEVVPAGNYAWLRLKVLAVRGELDSFVDLAAQPGPTDLVSLYVPGGAESGLQLNRGFTVAEGGFADFTIDFDLRKSVNDPQGFPDYRLRPTLRIVDNLEVGTITGSVDAELVVALSGEREGAVCAVYVFPGTEVLVDDIDADAEGPTDDGDLEEPLTTATVTAETVGEVTTYGYTVGFLLGGDYTLALTCEADLDDAEDNDGTVTFPEVAEVSVTAGETTVHDFVVAEE